MELVNIAISIIIYFILHSILLNAFGESRSSSYWSVIISVLVSYAFYLIFNDYLSSKDNSGKVRPGSISESQSYSKYGEYAVAYIAGFKGLDFYLNRIPSHHKSMGILHISDEGISFSLTNSKSSRWYKVAWGDIFGAHQQTENRMIGFGTRLYISTSKGTIIFVYDGDLDLSSLIQQYITEHEAAGSRRQETYQSLVRDHDFVSMSPDDFELFIKQLFSSMGYTVTRTGKSGDEGIDLVFEDSDQSLVIVQCKRYKNIISSSIIRDFFGAMQHVKAKKGYIITTSGFTRPAIEWSKGKPIVLIDKYELARLVKEVEEPLIKS